MKKIFKERTWRNKFRDDFCYMDGDTHMGGGEEWELMEDYIQKLIDEAIRNRTITIIEGLETILRFETNSLKKALKTLRLRYGYFSDLLKSKKKD